MKKLKILFLGSPTSYSQKVKNKLMDTGHLLLNPSQKPELIVVASYGHKISLKTLNNTKYGGLNIHPSLLPKYRGAAPVPWTILSGETQTGVTVFKMNQGWDTGPILAQKKVNILPHQTSKDLLNRLFSLGARLLISILNDYIDGKLTPKPQPQKSPTPYARQLTKKDGFVTFKDFVKNSKINFKNLDLKIRAFYPWPGVWTKLPNHKILKILPNRQVQLEGKQPISLKAFKNGHRHLFI